MTDRRPAAVIVLAAGEGTRMRSATPKVLHEVAGRPLLGHVLTAASGAGLADTVVVVVGHGRDTVADWLEGGHPQARSVVQEEQHGTGHAVRVALAAHPVAAGTVLVVSGDTPLLTAATIDDLLAAHVGSEAAATVLTARVADPTGYGRVIRSPDGDVVAVVEHHDATTDQLRGDEINSGIYAFDAAALGQALSRLTRDNSQGEEYLTDVVALLREAGRKVGAHQVADPAEVMGVNDRVQLAAAGAVLRERINQTWMRAGVTMVDPATTWVDSDVELEPDVVLLPGTRLHGRTRVARGARVGPDTTLSDTEVGEAAVVHSSACFAAVIGPGAVVGPFTHLRQGTHLGPDSKAGAFVETKNATVGTGSKVPHLSYVGDVEIGEGTNIGAATVVVNYDGVAKHRTVIGDQVRVGSDTMLVAPVTVGDGAYTAAGSVITEDVPPGAMAVGRARQRVIPGWVQRKRSGTPSAAAARRAVEESGGATEDPARDTGSSAATAVEDNGPEAPPRATEGHQA